MALCCVSSRMRCMWHAAAEQRAGLAGSASLPVPCPARCRARCRTLRMCVCNYTCKCTLARIHACMHAHTCVHACMTHAQVLESPALLSVWWAGANLVARDSQMVYSRGHALPAGLRHQLSHMPCSCICMCMYSVCTCVCVCACVCVYVCIHTYMYVCVHMCNALVRAWKHERRTRRTRRTDMPSGDHGICLHTPNTTHTLLHTRQPHDEALKKSLNGRKGR